MNEKELASGFNAGYTIQKHRPDLADGLAEVIKSEEAFFQGFIAGREQYSRERTRAKVVGRLREDMSRLGPTSKGRKKDKGGLDMDI